MSINLDDLKAPERVEWDKYKGGGSYTPPPVPVDAEGKPIVFTVRAPKEFKFEASRSGFLTAVMDPLVIVSPGKGEVRFTSANVAKFMVNGKPVEASRLGNYLRAIDKSLRPQTNQEYMRAVESTAGRTFQVTLDWDCWDKENGASAASTYTDFPVDPKNPAQRLPYIDTPDKRRLWARVKVKNFVAKA